MCIRDSYLGGDCSAWNLARGAWCVQAEDSDRYDITRHFGESFRFLDAAKRDGGTVLVHCALGINRSAAVCVAYMMLERRLPLLAVARIIKDRRRIVLANRAFQRQLVGFARARGLLGELPKNDDKDEDDGDDDGGDGRLAGTVRRLTLYDRASNGVDWRLNGLRADVGRRPHDTAYKLDWRPTSSSRPDDDLRRGGRAAAGLVATPGRHYFVSAAAVGNGDFSLSPHRKSLSRGSAATRSRETDDVTSSSYVRPRQYRASKSATSLVPVSTARHVTRAPVTAVHSRSSSASRFSLGFL